MAFVSDQRQIACVVPQAPNSRFSSAWFADLGYTVLYAAGPGFRTRLVAAIEEQWLAKRLKKTQRRYETKNRKQEKRRQAHKKAPQAPIKQVRKKRTMLERIDAWMDDLPKPPVAR